MSDRSAQRRARRWANAEQIAIWVPILHERYGDDRAILRAVSEQAYDGEQRCQYCNDILPKEYGSRSVQCLSCRRINWLTAETFFRNVHHLKAWWGTVWLMSNAGIVLTANQVKEIFGVALSTAQNILANIAFWVAQSQTESENSEDLSSSFLRPVYARRSIKTPADAHPEEEQDEIEKLHCLKEKLRPGYTCEHGESQSCEHAAEGSANSEPGVSSAPCEAQGPAIQALTAESANHDANPSDEQILVGNLSKEPVSLDQLLATTRLPLPRLLSAITIMELAGTIKAVPGNKFVLTPGTGEAVKMAATLPEKLAGTAISFIEFTKTFSHGIARKNVQLYLSMFWYYQSWPGLGSNWLFQQLRSARRLPRDELVAYVSPLILKIAAVLPPPERV